jgi:hypothetical protein
LCRAATSFFAASKEDVDGRDKPGHDVEGAEFVPCLTFGHFFVLPESFTASKVANSML